MEAIGCDGLLVFFAVDTIDSGIIAHVFHVYSCIVEIAVLVTN